MQDSNYEPDNSYGGETERTLSQTSGQEQYLRSQAQVREWYRNELGREPSDSEVDSHLGGDYGNDDYMRGVYSTIIGSSEGVDYRNRRGAEEAARLAEEEAKKNPPKDPPKDPPVTPTTPTGPKVGDVRYPGGSGYAAGNQYGPDIETWNGTAWVKTANPMYGREPDRGGSGPPRPPGPAIASGPARSPSVGAAPGAVAGVPPSYASMPKSPIAGTIPTLADAVAQAKQYLPTPPALGPRTTYTPQTITAPTPFVAPTITAPAPFVAPAPVGLEERNRVVQAILGQPDVMGQNFQDSLFEQQKEQQNQLAAQSRARLSQMTASRGLSAVGGTELLGQAEVEEGFVSNLLSARRDVSIKAAEANRSSQLAAVEMANAVQQGDFARAQTAYETQLKANQIYDQLRTQSQQFYDQLNQQGGQDYNRLLTQSQQFYDQLDQQGEQDYNRLLLQRAEQERSNIALASQNLLAQREMQMGEQGQSFDQYLRQLQMNEMIRQFNEQLALNYGKFGWEQQIGLAGLFPNK